MVDYELGAEVEISTAASPTLYWGASVYPAFAASNQTMLAATFRIVSGGSFNVPQWKWQTASIGDDGVVTPLWNGTLTYGTSGTENVYDDSAADHFLAVQNRLYGLPTMASGGMEYFVHTHERTRDDPVGSTNDIKLGIVQVDAATGVATWPAHQDMITAHSETEFDGGGKAYALFTETIRVVPTSTGFVLIIYYEETLGTTESGYVAMDFAYSAGGIPVRGTVTFHAFGQSNVYNAIYGAGVIGDRPIVWVVEEPAYQPRIDVLNADGSAASQSFELGADTFDWGISTFEVFGDLVVVVRETYTPEQYVVVTLRLNGSTLSKVGDVVVPGSGDYPIEYAQMSVQPTHPLGTGFVWWVPQYDNEASGDTVLGIYVHDGNGAFVEVLEHRDVAGPPVFGVIYDGNASRWAKGVTIDQWYVYLYAGFGTPPPEHVTLLGLRFTNLIEFELTVGPARQLWRFSR